MRVSRDLRNRLLLAVGALSLTTCSEERTCGNPEVRCYTPDEDEMCVEGSDLEAVIARLHRSGDLEEGQPPFPACPCSTVIIADEANLGRCCYEVTSDVDCQTTSGRPFPVAGTHRFAALTHRTDWL